MLIIIRPVAPSRLPPSRGRRLFVPPPTIWKRRLRPEYIAGELRRIGKKLVRRIRQPEKRVATLEARGEQRGRALVSYIVDGLLLPSDRPLRAAFLAGYRAVRPFSEADEATVDSFLALRSLLMVSYVAGETNPKIRAHNRCTYSQQ